MEMSEWADALSAHLNLSSELNTAKIMPGTPPTNPRYMESKVSPLTLNLKISQGTGAGERGARSLLSISYTIAEGGYIYSLLWA